MWDSWGGAHAWKPPLAIDSGMFRLSSASVKHFTTSAAPSLPLKNVKVLDLSRVLAGPWATQLFGDLGADVWKIERPGLGDDTRHWGPPFVKNRNSNGDEEDSNMTSYFSCANRNKKSLAIDIASKRGAAIVRELAKDCDIIFENFKVNGLEKYGLDYDSLSSLNPRLVYVSITGYGQEGPRSHELGYDFMVQAGAGLMSITGDADHPTGVKAGVAVVDVLTGMYAASLGMASLLRARETGVGEYIDLSLMDVGLVTLANQAAAALCTGNAPQRRGNSHPSICPYDALPTSDGSIVVAAGNDAQFRALSDIVEPSLQDNPLFATNPLRVQHRQALLQALGQATKAFSTAQLLDICQQSNVPASPINDLTQALEDSSICHREVVQHLPTGTDTNAKDPQTIPVLHLPALFRSLPREKLPRTPPPRLGQDTHAVLRDQLNISPAEWDSLCNEDIVQ